MDQSIKDVRSRGRGEGLLVVQANQLISSSQTLTLMEKRLVLLAAAKVDSRGTWPEGEDGVITITAAEFAKQYALKGGVAYEGLKAAAEKLFERKIRKIEQAGKRGKVRTDIRWVWQCTYIDQAATVKLAFTPDMAPFLSELNREFTKFYLNNVKDLSSVYAIRLYELCSQYRKIGRRNMTLKEFREYMDLGESYEKIGNLRMRVLNPSIAGVCEHTDLVVKCIDIKQGRSVVGFEFEIVEKDGGAARKKSEDVGEHGM